MKRNRAVFTICQNEPRYLPLWLRYYQKHFAVTDIYVLDHNTVDGSVREAWKDFRCNVVQVHRSESFNHEWLRDTVQRFQAFLLQSYDNVLFAEIDEFIVPDLLQYPRGLQQYIETNAQTVVRCLGLNVIQNTGEPNMDWTKPILQQRRTAWMSALYSKPLLARTALEWVPGFHSLAHLGTLPDTLDKNLMLFHLHRADYAYCLQRNKEMAARKWSLKDIDGNLGYQNRITDHEKFTEWFHKEQLGEQMILIPDHMKDAF